MSITGQHSDLIYLFLDGEATDTERLVLFEALKDSPQLQEELSTAMQSKAAFETDALGLQPPAYLQEQIAEKAGVILSNLASSPVAVASVSTVTAATPVILKSALLMIGSLSAGIVATLGIQKMIAPEADPKTTTVIERSAPSVGNRDAFTSPSNMSSASTFVGPSHSIVENTTPNQISEQSTHSAVGEDNISSSEKDILENENILPATNILTDRSEATIQDQPKNEAVDQPISPELATILPTSIQQQPLQAIIGEGNKRNPLDLRFEPIGDKESWTSNLSFGANYITTAIMRPERVVSGGSTGDINQVVLSAGYDISADGTLGIAAGKETFPIYLISSGVQTPHQSIFWGGAWYRHVVNEFSLPFDVHFYGQVLLGLGTPGPLGKLAAGLYWQANDNFSFMLAPEAMAVAFKQNGSITAGAKVGVTYSAMIHF